MNPLFWTVNMNHIALSQREALAQLLPQIESTGLVYEKIVQVDARLASEGEVVETSVGCKVANKGDFVVRDLKTRKLSIMSRDRFRAGYRLVVNEAEIFEQWFRYQAVGECLATQYVGPDLEFRSSRGERAALVVGDLILTPLPDKNEVCRMTPLDFVTTYRPKPLTE